MKRFYTIIAIFLTLSITAKGQENKLSINTINRLNEIERDYSTKLTKSYKEKPSEIGAYIIIEKDADPYIIETTGAKVNMVIDTIVSARIPLDAINEVAALDIVKKIDVGGRAKPKMNKAREAIKVSNIISGIDLPSAYTGKGVVIGIIDGGVQLDHINFYDKDGNLRIKRVWNQPINTGTPPEGFSYGSEYKTEDEIVAAGYDDASETHGSHVLGIAAGSCKENDFYGIAPETDIVVVGYNYYDTSLSWSSITDAIGYIYDYADSVGKPCVINISLGDVYGPHDGCSIFDQACDALQGEGKLLVGSAGNEGINRQHIKKTFTTEQDSLRTFVSLLTKYSTYYATQCDFYGEYNKEFKIKVCAVKTSDGTIINETETVSSKSMGSHEFSLSKVNNLGANASIQITCELEPGSNRPHINVIALASSVITGYTIGFKIIGDTGTTIHGWADDYYSRFTNKSTLDGWTPGDFESNIAEIGGTGKRIISVGSYKINDFGSNINLGDISTFSSKGPTIDGRMKPDITAPGEWIVSSYSNSDAVLSSSSNISKIKQGDTITVDGINYYWGSMKGTSMSAPMVTGTLALWLEANPNLTPEDIREVLSETAIRDEWTGSQPNNTWGYGKLDAWNGLKKVLELSGIEEIESNSQNDFARIFVKDGYCKILFAKDLKKCEVSIYDITGKLINSQNLGNINGGYETSIDESNGLKGIYVVKISGEDWICTQKIAL